MRYFWLALIILIGCGKSNVSSNNRLKISFYAHPSTSDPRKAGDFISSTLVCMVYDGLTRCLPGGSVEPALSERVEISEDQKTYTFHLRKAFWSDGEPIKAIDFEKSWKQILSPPSSSAFLFYPIKNGELCAKGLVSVDEVGVKALDEKTLQVQLERPTPYFYSLTAFPSFLPVPAHASESLNIYSGPFCIQKTALNREILLAKNPSYWNREGVFLDEVHISIIQDEMTALQLFEQGDLHWIGGAISPLPPDALVKLKERLRFIPSAATTICTFNTETFPFNNLHLRRAFSYAIDREELAQEGQTPASSILPPPFTDQSYPLSDPEKARAHLALALEELQISPKELESMTLYFKQAQVEKRLAQTLQRQWKEVLGITLNLGLLDFKSHAQRLQSRDYQIALGAWIAQFDDPISILERFKDRSNLKNYPGWQEAEYAELLNESGSSSERKIRLQKAEDLLASHVPLTPIYHWRSAALTSGEVEEIPTTPCGGILFERFQLKKQKSFALHR